MTINFESNFQQCKYSISILAAKKVKIGIGCNLSVRFFKKIIDLAQPLDNNGTKVGSFYQLLTAKSKLGWFFVSQRTKALIGNCSAETLQLQHKFCDYYSKNNAISYEIILNTK